MAIFPADLVASCFPILGRSGSVIGFVDSIRQHDQVTEITGWTSADEVGLQSGNHRMSKQPDQLREDVFGAFPVLATQNGQARLGFTLIGDAPAGDIYFFARQGSDTYYFLL